MALQSKETVTGKDSLPIEPGDTVWSKSRGGKHEGVVEHVLETPEDVERAADAGELQGVSVKHPPKVVFTDQVCILLIRNALTSDVTMYLTIDVKHGHRVSHNPEALQQSDGAD